MFDVIVRTYYCSFLGKKKKSQNNKERILSRNKNVYILISASNPTSRVTNESLVKVFHFFHKSFVTRGL